MKFILSQLARTGLLPASESKELLAGNALSLSDLIPHLLISALDADAMTVSDKTASWTQRRQSRQLLGLTFLVVFLLHRTLEPGSESGAAMKETNA